MLFSKEMKNWIYTISAIVFVFLISVLPNIPLPISIPVRVSNTIISLYNSFIEWLPFLFILGLFVSGFIIAFVKKHRARGIRALLRTIFIIVLFYLSNSLLSPILRDYSKGYAINRLNVLIRTLEDYRTKNGAYPESIHLLVPDYIKEIPKPRIISVSNVDYRKGNEDYTLLLMQHINGWDADIMIFNSRGDYSEIPHELRIYGTWRYYFKQY